MRNCVSVDSTVQGWTTLGRSRFNSVNQSPPPLVCLRVFPRLGESMKSHTFVTRLAAATADNSTIRAAHKATNRMERLLQLADNADSRNRIFTDTDGVCASAAQHNCRKLELAIHSSTLYLCLQA